MRLLRRRRSRAAPAEHRNRARSCESRRTPCPEATDPSRGAAPISFAIRPMISRSGLAPMVCAAFFRRCTSPQTLVTVPFFRKRRPRAERRRRAARSRSGTYPAPRRKPVSPRSAARLSGFAPTTQSTSRSPAASISGDGHARLRTRARSAHIDRAARIGIIHQRHVLHRNAERFAELHQLADGIALDRVAVEDHQLRLGLQLVAQRFRVIRRRARRPPRTCPRAPAPA